MRRNIDRLIAYTNRFNPSWHQQQALQALPAQIRQEFDRLKSKYETYTESVSNFEPLKARHESKKEAVITAAAAPYLGGENESLSWWQRAREKVIEFLRAEGVIAKFLREISISMKKVSMM